MKSAFFITGTDTNIGKTWTTVALLRKFKLLGLKVAGMKPVASGCDWQDGRYKNPDALLIQANSDSLADYEVINPYAFALPISPHLACGDVKVSLPTILRAFEALYAQADVVLVEGAGGWLSPLSLEYDNASLAIAMQLPVILVVGMRLGCINHALLSYQAIQHSGVHCAGWIAVVLDQSMPGLAENLEILVARIHAPLLGVMPFLPEADFDFLADRFKCVERLI